MRDKDQYIDMALQAVVVVRPMPTRTDEYMKLTSPDVLEDKELLTADERFNIQRHAVMDLTITDQDSLKVGAESAVILQKMEKWFIAKRQEMVKQYKERVEAIEADFRLYLKPIAEMRAILNRKQAAYLDEQEEKARALREAQDKILREQEAVRQAAEDKKREEELKAAAAAHVDAPPVPLIMPEALMPALVVPVPEVPTNIVTISGSSSSRKVWQVEIVSVKEICKAVHDGFLPEHIVEIDQVALVAWRQAQEDAQRLTSCPGTRFFQERRMTNRG